VGPLSRHFDQEILSGPVLAAARELLGAVLEVDSPQGTVAIALSEVEAYAGLADPASHAYRGRTARNAVMFGPAGHMYVYFSYGVHWCANVVTGPEGAASAVLLRALDPVAGVEAMRQARWRTQKRQIDRDLCRGPGRLTQALGIDRSADGVDLCDPGAPFSLASDGMAPPPAPAVSSRIGISVALETLWRFSVPGHPGVSGP